MKHFYLLLITMVCGVNLLRAQDCYIIEAYDGAVEYKTISSPQWEPIRKGVTLLSADSIRIHKKGSIRITYRNQDYTIDSPFYASVSDVVDHKRSEQSKRFSHRGFLKEIRSGKKSPFRISVDGISEKRELDSNIQALAKQLIWIAAQVNKGRQSPQIEGITCQKHVLKNGELKFEIANNSQRDYYVNILHINKRTKKVSLCYVIMPDIKANACILIPSGFLINDLGISFPNSQDDEYVLIAMKDPYDSYGLDNELASGAYNIDNPQEIDCDILYMYLNDHKEENKEGK